MVTTRSSKNKTNTQVSNNTDKNVVVDEVHNASVPNNESDFVSESESEYEYHSEKEELSDDSNDSDDYDDSDDSDDSFDIEKEELYMKKKHEAINIINENLRKFDILINKGHISLQCKNTDENPEFMDIIYILYNTVMNYDIYISYKAEKQFDKLYDTCIDRLYHTSISLFKNYKRPDLSFNIYNKYKDYYNLSYDKIFLNFDDYDDHDDYDDYDDYDDDDE